MTQQKILKYNEFIQLEQVSTEQQKSDFCRIMYIMRIKELQIPDQSIDTGFGAIRTDCR
jgi:hypothetical protein